MYQYSAEQIKVPASLPEILKNYAKQVIKNQPNDIMEFSKEYFTRLAKQNSHSTKNTQLTKLQIEAFYSKVGSFDLVLCSRTGGAVSQCPGN
jgi:hypothetical protein